MGTVGEWSSWMVGTAGRCSDAGSSVVDAGPALKQHSVNPQSFKQNNYNFQPLEVVSCYRDPQLQVAENYLIL